jgi:ubiquinone/menaquinone biosynthesis C-methylase UbiE
MKENRRGPLLPYSAKTEYQAESIPVEYEQKRFSGLLGRYRYKREQLAVSSLVGMLPYGIIIADCPCGNGRWWSLLAQRASRIIALDVSQGMLKYAKERASKFDIEIEVREGNAEKIDLQDGSVDYVFSHALTKHLPIPIQYLVLAEFSRISRIGVICSFGIFSHFTYEFWRHRHIEESYPIFIEELEWMAKAANLQIRTMRKCTTPIGVEYTVLFDKLK